jgi:hypothetical protein
LIVNQISHLPRIVVKYPLLSVLFRWHGNCLLNQDQVDDEKYR